MNGPESDRLQQDSAESCREELVRTDKEHDETEASMEERATELEKKEQELKEWAAQLEARERQAQVVRSELDSQRRTLEEDRREIDRQLTELDLRGSQLDTRSAALQERAQKVHEREMSLKTAEQTADQEAAEDRRSLEKELFDTREAARVQMDRERMQQIEKLAQEIAERRAAAEAALAAREKEALDVLDRLYREAEKKRSDAYAALAQELEASRSRTAGECGQMRLKVQGELERQRKAQEQELAEQAQALSRREADLGDRENILAEDRAKVDQASAKNIRDRKRLDIREDELDAREEDLADEVKRRSADLVRDYESRLKVKEDALEQLRGRLAQLMREQAATENFKEIYGDSPMLIQEKIAQLIREREELEQRLAESPSKAVQEERDRLRGECERYESENQGLQQQIADLIGAQRNVDRVQNENIRLQDTAQDLQFQISVLTDRCDAYQSEISRLSSAQSRLAEFDERMKVIRSGGADPLQGVPIASDASECAWLDRIWENCRDFGMVFPRRILYAFHTALKISDWSMITVLSGVSGTGKSELPKLYAAFGGMNFINVPVQPSWDSQESMLGFFNSIDNRFEPEPLLRFLVQCTEDSNFNEYMSIVLLDEMNLAHVEHYFADFLSKLESRRSTDRQSLPSVEVKLGAGVEPYLLELKRSILWTGTMNQDETTKSLSDKVLDRGLVIYFPRPEHLVDREKMISLNRAVRQSGRTLMTVSVWNSWIFRKMGSLGAGARRQIDSYRDLVEQINHELEGTGRALGHRVWQAIEYYIVNYPMVRTALEENVDELTPELRAAMDTAFEDQLVQKVMPKLRGIETRGEGRQHLRNIEDLLEKAGFGTLKADFDLAMELGYGQFIWSSAKYIQAAEGSAANAGTADTPESDS